MNPTTRAALLGAAALLALGLLLLALRPGSSTPVPPATDPAAAAAAVDLLRSAGLDDRSDPAARVELPPEQDGDASALAHPFPLELEVRIVDRLGLPVEGARLLLAPPACRLDEVPERSDSDGRVTVRWNARVASMPVTVAIRADETRDAMRILTVRSGTPARVVLGGARGRGTGVRLVMAPSGIARADRIAFRGFEGPGGQELVLVSELGLFSDNPPLRAGLHPAASFGDLQWPDADRAAGRAVLSGAGPGLRLNLSFGSFEVQTGRAEDAAGTPTRVDGVVRGEDGRPCADCPVSFGRTVDRPSATVRSDAQGAFRFDSVPEGALELRAGGGDEGLAHLTVHALRGQTTTVDVQLRREARVEGRVLTRSGEPLAGWRVEWVGTAEPWFDACTTGADGGFVLPNLPGGAGSLLLWNDRAEARLPAQRLDHVLPDNAPLELRVDPEVCKGALLIEPLLPDGADRAALEVRVFQEESGRGTTLSRVDESNRFVIQDLPAGWYRVELGGPGFGWADSGRQFVDGTGPVDLGRVGGVGIGMLRLEGALPGAAPEPGSVDGPSLEVYRRREDSDVRIDRVAVEADRGLPLPAGGYFVFWRTADGQTAFDAFTIHAGRETVVRCSRGS
jgi:hypothetical protein